MDPSPLAENDTSDIQFGKNGGDLQRDGIERVRYDVAMLSVNCWRSYLESMPNGQFVEHVVPVFKGGAPIGWKVVIHKDGVLSRLGLRTGDIVSKVAGAPLRSPAELAESEKKLMGRFPSAVELEIHRDAQAHNLIIVMVEGKSLCKAFRNRGL